MSKPSREWVGLSAPPPATRPLTGAEVVGVQQPDPENPGEYNSRPTTLTAIMEDIGGGGSASAITSPDASARQEALDDGAIRTTIGGRVVELTEQAQRLLSHVLASGRFIETSIGDTRNSYGVPLSGLVQIATSPDAPPIEFPSAPTDGHVYTFDVLGDASLLGGANEGKTTVVVIDGLTSAMLLAGKVGAKRISGFSAVSGIGTAGAVAEVDDLAAQIRLIGELVLQTVPAEGAPTSASMLWIDSNSVVRRGNAPAPAGMATTDYVDDEVDALAADLEELLDADLVKRLGNVFTLSANTVLDDSYSGSVIFTDTSGGARQHTVPTTVSAGWNAVFVREGANTLKVIGDGTMLMKGPAAAANEVAIAVDDGGVSVIRRSATKCWCAGKIS